eukprot:6187594-Pleurochrysis_carterae.AAC.2
MSSLPLYTHRHALWFDVFVATLCLLATLALETAACAAATSYLCGFTAQIKTKIRIDSVCTDWPSHTRSFSGVRSILPSP